MSFLAALPRGKRSATLEGTALRLTFDLPLCIGAFSVGPCGDGWYSCTADQKLERCVVAKNRAQEVRESPR
jgi:hypothetical protein